MYFDISSSYWKSKTYVVSVLVFLVLSVSLISIIHLSNNAWLNVSVTTLGSLWLCTILLTISYLGRSYFRTLIFVFLFFFLIGYFFGPFLEPPSDPLEHLRRVYSYCGLSSNDLPINNRGFWHYTMSSLFLCNESLTKTPESTLHTIDFLHGLYQGLLLSSLFIMGKSAGLPSRWSFFSALTAFLFLGTNKFSFFSYYSLAASASSMLVYWLWISAFFFRQDRSALFYGTVFALASLPVLWINHKQEAAFIGFIFVIWILIYAHKWIWLALKQSTLSKIIYLSIVLLVFVIIPQHPQVYEWMSETNNNVLEELAYNWRTNQYLFVHWFSFYQIANFWGYRVGDSLGLMGFLPVILVIPLLLSKIKGKRVEQIRIIILSLLPLILMLTPLFSSIWVASLKAATAMDVYWRMVYSSLYWLALAAILFRYEQNLLPIKWMKKIRVFPNKWVIWFDSLSGSKGANLGFLLCLFLLVLLSSIRSAPVFGKLDFITVDSRSWWCAWQDMINQLKGGGKPIYSDYTTSLVLHDIFNYDVAYVDSKGESYRALSLVEGEMDIKKMEAQKEYRCIINLKGFNASWIPRETRHWQHSVTLTNLQYQYAGSEKLEELALRKFNNCVIYR